MAEFNMNRRKNYYIDHTFQSRFIVKFCLVVLCASVLMGMLICLFNMQSSTVAFENLRVVVKSTADFVFPTMMSIIFIVTIFSAIATIAVTLFTSHKISGPLYNLTMVFERMKIGDFSKPIRIRSGDQLQKAAESAENMRTELRSRLNEIKKDWGSIKLIINKLNENAISPNEKKQLEDNIKKVDLEFSSLKTE